MTDQTIEAAARAAADKCWDNDLNQEWPAIIAAEFAPLIAAKDAAIAALKQRVAELEKIIGDAIPEGFEL